MMMMMIMMMMMRAMRAKVATGSQQKMEETTGTHIRNEEWSIKAIDVEQLGLSVKLQGDKSMNVMLDATSHLCLSLLTFPSLL